MVLDPAKVTEDDQGGVLDVCDACNGTGLEEGEEWAGTKCRECKGTKFILVDDEPMDDAIRYALGAM